ncbi:hypothetical protein NC653_028251 [Populus alba x Populus x berolinensis]|uniref:Uncharacterized protein n=1 Tax=Populus alba x Populus x berolinensis TaxID=444605 RepID=A0AAD6M7J0_9ROSI|nr:hypothetical protein NC653_028251 [Populus alba x Populus x berolinensis]
MSAAETCRLNSSSRWQTGLLRPSLKKSSILFSFKEINYKYMSSRGGGGVESEVNFLLRRRSKLWE